MRQLRCNQDSFYCRRGVGNKSAIQQLSQDHYMIFMNQVLTCICRYLYILNKKNSHENLLVFFKKPLFFYLLLACPTVNSGKFFRGQPLSPNVNHCVCQVFQTKVYWKPYNGVGSLSLTKHLLGFAPGTFCFDVNALITNQATPH